MKLHALFAKFLAPFNVLCAAPLIHTHCVPGQESMGKEERVGLKVLAHALVGLAATLDCTLETFSLGPAARVCGVPGPPSLHFPFPFPPIHSASVCVFSDSRTPPPHIKTLPHLF